MSDTDTDRGRLVAGIRHRGIVPGMPFRPSHRPCPDRRDLRAQPLYERICDHLRQRILDGEWDAGERLPGRAALAKDYHVNLATIQSAIRKLVGDGILAASPRSGTFVRTTSAASPARGPRRILVVTRPQHASPGMRGSWSGGVVNEIIKAAEEAGARVAIAPLVLTGDGIDWRSSLAPSMGGRIPTILVYQDPEPICTDDLRAAVEGQEHSTVLIGWERSPVPVSQVAWDQWDAGHQAAAHLIAHGWAGIRLFCPFRAPWAEQRWEGAKAAAGSRRLPLRHASDPPRAAFPADALAVKTLAVPHARRFIADGGLRPGNGGHPPGVLAGNDAMAIALMDAAAEAGLRPGRDFGLVGFDDLPEATTRDLTSLRPPFAALGRAGCDLALRDDGAVSTLLLRLRLRIRPSSQAWR